MATERVELDYKALVKQSIQYVLLRSDLPVKYRTFPDVIDVKVTDEGAIWWASIEGSLVSFSKLREVFSQLNEQLIEVIYSNEGHECTITVIND